ALEITLLRPFEERGQTSAGIHREVGRGDQPTTVDQVRGEGDVGRGEAEHRTNQHGHFFIAQALFGLLEVKQHGLAEVDVALLAEVAGEFAQYHFVKVGGAVDPFDLNLHQTI